MFVFVFHLISVPILTIAQFVNENADPKVVLSKLESVDEKLKEQQERIAIYSRYQTLFKVFDITMFVVGVLILSCAATRV